jgi:hypothetical protein
MFPGKLDGLLVFTRHPSGLSRDKSLLTALECQVQAAAVGAHGQKMHLMIAFSRIAGDSEIIFLGWSFSCLPAALLATIHTR